MSQFEISTWEFGVILPGVPQLHLRQGRQGEMQNDFSAHEYLDLHAPMESSDAGAGVSHLQCSM
eukprot:499469-Karenia_brevis.AAC.1